MSPPRTTMQVYDAVARGDMTAEDGATLLMRLRDDPCTLCGSPSFKAIYMGLPLRMCEAEDCRCAWGLGTWLMGVWFNGHLMVYGGSYWRALWSWLTDGDS